MKLQEIMLSKQEMEKEIGLFLLESAAELQRDYVFIVDITQEGDFTHIIIKCPATNFSMAYYQLGRLSAKKMMDHGVFKKRK